MVCAAVPCFLAAYVPGVAASETLLAARFPSAFGLAAGPGARGPVLYPERRVFALEQGRAAESKESASRIGQTSLADGIVVSLDAASIVDGKQLLLEYNITNQGAAPILVIIAPKDSSLTLRGEARPRPFRVQGLAICPPYQRQVTQYCMDRAADEQWTQLEPGAAYQFQVSTRAARGRIESDTASARLRLLVRKGKETRFHDISFANIPIAP